MVSRNCTLSHLSAWPCVQACHFVMRCLSRSCGANHSPTSRATAKVSDLTAADRTERAQTIIF
eukprot:5148998-Prymnesium_polylepis.1